MGKKSHKIRTTEPVPYSKKERENKVKMVYFQLVQIDMYHVLTDNHKQQIEKFIKDGTSYVDTIELPAYSRVMSINFVNDKRNDKKTGIGLKFNKIRVDDDNSPINKLNAAQEHMVDMNV